MGGARAAWLVAVFACGAFAPAAHAGPDVTAPPLPAIVLPVGTVVSPLPGFVWKGVLDQAPNPLAPNGDVVSGVASYTFELSQFASFSSNIVTNTAATPSFQLPAAQRLTFGSTYFWRVTVRDNAGNARTTPTQTFTVQARTVNYRLTVDDDCAGGFTTPAIDVLTTATAASAPRFPLVEGVSYCWRVKATDVADNVKVTSTRRIVLSDRYGPTTPVVVEPSPASTLIDNTPGFTWLPSLDNGVVTYAVQVSTSNLFTSLVNIGTATNLTTTGYQIPDANALARSTNYFVRVVSKDALGNTTNGDPVAFRIDDRSPRYLFSLAQESPASRFFDFNDGALPTATATFGSAAVVGGVGFSGSAMRLTQNVAAQQGSFIVSDFTGGGVVKTFTAAFKVRADGGSAIPADGWSFVFASDLTNASFGEEGAGTGLTVSFDIFDNGGGEAPAINVRWRGVDVAVVRPGLNTLMTGESGSNVWADVVIKLDPDGTLDLTYDGLALLSNVQTPYTPLSGARFGFGARTSANVSNFMIDDVKLTVGAPVLELPDLATTSYALTNPSLLQDGLQYFWRVTAIDRAGNARLSRTNTSVDRASAFTLGDTYPPSVAEAAFPDDGATIIQSVPTLVWDAAADAKTFTVTVATNRNLTSPVHTLSTSARGVAVPAALTRGTQYFWKIRSVDVRGNGSDSPVYSFIVDKKAVAYNLQVATTTTFSSPIVDRKAISTPSYTAVAGESLPETTQLYWRIVATDVAGNSRVSTKFNGMKLADRYPPPTPELTYPVEQAEVLSPTPVFMWDPVFDNSGVVRYRFELSTNDLFSAIVVQRTGLSVPSVSLTTSERLTPTTRYFWRVTATDATNQASIPAVGSFKVAPRAATYDFALSRQVDLSTPFFQTRVNGISTQLPQSAALDAGITYYWQVGAVDGAGNRRQSLIKRFAMADRFAPEPPDLDYPASQATIVNDKVCFAWGPARDSSAVTYKVQVSRNNIFAPLVAESPVQSAQAYCLPAALPRDNRYFWRVIVADAAGNTGTSVTDQFTVEARGALYTIELATDSTFSAPVLQRPDIASASYTLAQGEAVNEGARYFWRVKAVDRAGNSRTARAPFAFQLTDRFPPAIPDFLFPAADAELITAQPSFSWEPTSDFSGGVRYTFELARDIGFSNVVTTLSQIASTSATLAAPLVRGEAYYIRLKTHDAAGNVGVGPAQKFSIAKKASSYTFVLSDGGVPVASSSDLKSPTYTLGGLGTTLVEGKTYTWSVQARDGTGNIRNAVKNFTFALSDLYAPTIPELQYPDDRATMLNARVGFRWDAATDPAGVSYRLQVAENASFSPILIDQSAGTATVYQLTAAQALVVDKSYFWRVVVTDGRGNSAATSSQTFTVSKKAPDYFITIKNATSQAVVVQGTTKTTSYSLPPATALVDGQRYTWFVEAVDAAGGRRTSLTRGFILNDIYPPSLAELTYPRSKDIQANPRVSFAWGAATDATNSITYAIDVSAVADFSTIIESKSALVATQYSLVNALPREKTYFWRVRAIDSNGRSSTSKTGEFSVAIKKARYRLDLTPGTDATAFTSPEFSLDTPEGITQKSLIEMVSLRLREETNYVWRVRAIDGSGNEKLSNTFRRFRLSDRYPPPSPGLLYPSDFGEVVNARVGFLWESVVDAGPNPAVTYSLEVSTTPDFAALVLNKRNLTTNGYQSSFTEKLPSDAVYYWRVKAKDSLGFEVTTTARRFKVLRSVVHYVFTVSNDQNFTDILYRTTDLTIPSQLLPSPVALTEAKQYWWQVQATDDAGHVVPSTNGPFRLVLVDRNPPVPPNLVYPGMGVVVADSTPGFVWERAVDPSGASYSIEIARDDKFTDIVLAKKSVGTAFGFDLPTALDRDVNYFWRVYSRDSFGNESVSTPSVFGVGPRGVKYTLQVANDPAFTSIARTYTGIRVPYSDTPILDAYPMNQDFFWRVTATDALDRTTVSTRSFKFNVKTLALIRRGGLEAFYYDGVNFDAEKLRRIDPVIDFPVVADGNVNGDFDTGIGPDTFSVRWVGWFEATATGSYTFYTTSDDGQRFYVDGALVVDDWAIHTATTRSVVRSLTAGWHSVVYETFENLNSAVSRLEFSGPGQARQVIPSNLLAVIGNPGDKVPPIVQDAYIAAAGPDIATIHVDANEPVLVTIDYGATGALGKSVQTATLAYSADIILPQAPSGTMVYRVSIADAANNKATGKVLTGCTPTLSQITPGEIRGRYYAGTEFNTQRMQKADTSIQLNVAATDIVAAVGSTNYSVRWEGLYQAPANGSYSFYGTSDDGQRMFVDGIKGINDWLPHLPTERSFTRTLAIGYRPFRYEMFQGDAGARGVAEATAPGGARAVIAGARLARIADVYYAPVLPTLSTLGPIEATSPAGTPVAVTTPAATDCRDPSPVVAGTVLPSYPVGTNAVTWTATNRFGEATRVVQLVKVQDTKAPAVVGGPDLTLRCDSPLGDGLTERSRLALNKPTVTDNGDANPLVWDDAPDAFEVDVPVDVTVHAKDASGNEGTDVYTVVVKEGGSLIVDGGGELIVARADNCTLPAGGTGTRVTLRQPTANGLCKASTPVTFTHNYPTAGNASRDICVPSGITQVTWNASGGGLTGQDIVAVRVVKSDLVVAVDSAPSGWIRTNASMNARIASPFTATNSSGALALTWAVRGDRAPSSEVVRADGTYSATFLEDGVYCPLTVTVTDARGLLGIATPPCFGIDRSPPTTNLTLPEKWVRADDPTVVVNVVANAPSTYPHNFMGERINMLFTALDMNGTTVSGLGAVSAQLTNLTTNTTTDLTASTFSSVGTLPTGPGTASVNACLGRTFCDASDSTPGAVVDSLNLSALGRGSYKLTVRMTDKAGNVVVKDYYFKIVDFTDGLEASALWVDGTLANLVELSAEPQLLSALDELETASRLQMESPDHSLLLTETALKQLSDVFVTTGTDTRFLTEYLPRGAKAETRWITETFQKRNLPNWSLFGASSGHLSSPHSMGDFVVVPKRQTDLAISRLARSDEELRIGQEVQSMASTRRAFEALSLVFRDDVYGELYGYPARSAGNGVLEAYFNNATTDLANIGRYVASTVVHQIDRVDDDPGIPFGARQPLARVKTNMTNFGNGVTAVAIGMSDNEDMVRNVYMTAAQSLADLDAMQRNALATQQWRTGMALTLAYAMHFSVYSGQTALTKVVPRGAANPLVDVAECRLNRIVDAVVEDRLDEGVSLYADSKCLIVETFNRYYGRGRLVPGQDPCINPADYGCPVAAGAQVLTGCPVVDQNALVAAGGRRWDPVADCAY